LMRENIEELPTIIRVAKLLNVDRVNAAWMIAFNEKMARSSLFRHAALANACLRRAHEVGGNVPPASPVLEEVNAITGSKERAYGSPLQQSADERRLQAQVAACPP